MDELLKKINDLNNRCINKNIITFTNFLTPTEKQQIIINLKDTKVIFFGGKENSERVRAFFLPEYINEVDFSQYIIVLKAEFSFKNLSHRDFLGSLLSLGIDRKCIGDILVFEKEAYFFVTKDISKFVITNLTKVGNIGVKISQVGFDDVPDLKPKFKEINFTVSSLRLDSIVAGAIKESREKTSSYIKNGLVLLNYIECVDVSKEVKENDIFSVKGYGKFILSEIGGKSRREKIFIKVNKYV